MGIKFKKTLSVDDVRDLSVASYFGIMLMDAGEHSTLINCVLSLSRKYTVKCNPESKSTVIYNDQYFVQFVPGDDIDPDDLVIVYRCDDDDYDSFISQDGAMTSLFRTVWDADTLGDFTYE